MILFKPAKDMKLKVSNTQGKGNAPKEDRWDCMGHYELMSGHQSLDSDTRQLQQQILYIPLTRMGG